MTPRASTSVASASPSLGQRFRGDVEGLRAVAVTAVVVAHADARLAPGGYVGVDVFFVISGFLITLLLLREHASTGRVSLSRFWARRVRRLLPMSSLTLVASLVVAWLVFPAVDVPDVASSARSAALFQENWHLIAGASDYFARDLTHDPVLHFWSLGVEEQFYALWPALLAAILLVVRRLSSRRARLASLSVVLLVLVVASLVASVNATSSTPVSAYYSLRTRAWELAVGALVAVASGPLAARLTRRACSILALSGAVAIGLAFAIFDSTTPFPGIAAALPVVGAGAVIAAGCSNAPTVVARALGSAVPRLVGRVSYSWYLWHWPTIVTFQVAFLAGRGPGAQHGSEARRAVVIAAAVAISFLLAVASQRLVEAPIRSSAWLRRSRPATLALGAGLVGVVLGSSAILNRQVSTTAVVVARTLVPVTSPRPGTHLVGDLLRARRDWLGTLRPCVYRAQADARASCVLGDLTAGSRVVVAGDSHAAALVPALDALARARHWRLEVATHNGCPFLDARVATAAGIENRYCEQWHTAVVRRLLDGGPIALLIVANANAESTLVLGDDGRGLTGSQVPAAWGRDLARMLARFRPVAAGVVVFQEPALPASDPIECLTRNADDVTRCSFSRTAHAHPDRALLVGGTAELRPVGVRYADLTSLLCPLALCPVVTGDGTIIFKDAGHLARAFSASISELVGHALDTATPAPTVL